MKKTTQLLAASLVLALSACAAEYEPMEGVRVKSSVNQDGEVAEISAAIDKSVLRAFHAEERNGVAYADYDSEVKEQTFFRHIGMDYNAHGHGPPGVNDLPHIDIHYYGIDQVTREAIDCRGEPMPEDERVPEGVEVNVNAEPFGGCVAGMGAHGAFPYERLTADMIYGYHQGELIFVEPMIDIELVFAEERIELPIPLPAKIGRDTRMATRFVTRHTADEYVFVLTDFIPVQ